MVWWLWFVGWLVGWLLVGWLIVWFIVGQLGGLFVGAWLVCWLVVGLLASWSAGCVHLHPVVCGVVCCCMVRDAVFVGVHLCTAIARVGGGGVWT